MNFGTINISFADLMLAGIFAEILYILLEVL